MADESFNRENVVALIETVFPDQPFNGNVVYEGGEKYEDSAMTAVHFGGKSWKGFKPKFLRKYSDSIHFFSNEAYVFFLPAFLVAVIEAYDDVDALVETVVGTLVPVWGDDNAKDEARLFAERSKRLSHDQKRAVAAFLRHIKEVHGETFLEKTQQDALDAYWGKFL